MKQSVQLFRVKWFLLLAFSSFLSVVVWAQDSGSSSTTTSTTKKTNISITSDGAGNNAWYMSPWVWVIGAAVFILLLVALLSNRGGRDTVATSDRVTVKKTVERETDI